MRWPCGALEVVSSHGAILTLGATALKSGQQIHATRDSFAAILADGSIVTWGNPHCGGDSDEVRDQLTNVEQIHATHSAFAAILADGSVVTWGYPALVGDSTRVRDQLRHL